MAKFEERPEAARAVALVALALALSLSCGRSERTSGDGSGQEVGGTGSGQGGTGAGASTNGGSSTSGTVGEGGDGGDGEPDCTTGSPPESPIRRLNRFEYNNTVRDAFGDMTRPADALARFADVSDIVATDQMVEGYHQLAHDFGLRVTEDDAAMIAFIGCDPADGEAACQREFVTAFLRRVFRRPATTSDQEAFSGVFANGRMLGGNFRSGVRAVVEVALQSPEFLYRPEFGEPAEDRGPGWARPSSYEMASRLSYLYWGSPPDAELLDNAENDDLGDPAVIETQARRLLADPRARDVVGQFYLALLGVLDASFPASEGQAFPSFTAEIARLLPEETRAFTAELTLSGEGDFSALLTAPYTFVNGPLAGFYGIDGITGNDFRRVELDETRRSGIFSHAGFLAATSYSVSTNPSRRGAIIANALLCAELPDHPTDVPVPDPPDPNATTRQNLERATAPAACQGCHAIFDPLGFAFEHFDAAGLWRETENGLAIDATGELVVSDVAGTRFDGAVELMQLIARSEDARRCFVQNWFRYAHGRRPTTGDACSLETLDRAFQSVDLNLLELLVVLGQNDAFLYRPEVIP